MNTPNKLKITLAAMAVIASSAQEIFQRERGYNQQAYFGRGEDKHNPRTKKAKRKGRRK